MPLIFGLLLESIIIYIVFKNIRKNSTSKKEAFITIILMYMSVMLALSLPLEFGIVAIIGNVACIVIMMTVATIKTKNVHFSLFYAIFTIIIILLSASTASSVLTIASFMFPSIELGRDGVMGSWVISAVYLVLVFIIAFAVSRKIGNWVHVQIRVFDEELQKKLAKSILVGAFITLGVFFTLVFLRDILYEANMLTFVYGLSLFVVFVYLAFSIFSLTESLRKDIELKRKNEMLHNLESYTQHVETMATEMRQFRHDHRNLMLGFREHAENKDWVGFDKYYEGYMGEFVACSDVIEANSDQLSNIKTPELKSILFAKFMQASNAGIGTFIEVDGEITISGGYNLLDTCRIAGILMDNALEACKGVAGADIRLMATMIDGKVCFVLQNTCPSPPPPINKLGQKGFTTKEGTRGLGLYTVANLIARNNCLALETSISDGYFVQKLNIEQGD